MTELNRIDRIVHEFDYPRYFPFFQKRKLRPTYISFEGLQSKFIQWNKDAYEIIKEPNLIFPSSTDTQTVFLHVTALLRDIRSRLDSDMLLLLNSFNRTYDDINIQINFVVATTSFVATLAGLIATLLSMRV